MAKKLKRRIGRAKRKLRGVTDLQVYLKTRGDGGAGRTGRLFFAKRCGTSLPYLYQVAFGLRKPSLDLAFKIERHSDGIVSAENLRPDADWSYIQSRSQQQIAA